MIAYLGKDRQDALDRGVIDSLDIFESDYIGVANAQIINNLTVDIVNHSYGTDRISMSAEAFADIKRAKRQNYELIYDREGMTEDAGNRLEEMFDRLYERLFADLQNGDESSPLFRHHLAKLCAMSRSITAETYLAEDPHQVVVDYISSMTDNYFMALYEHLVPGEAADITSHSYCADL